MYQTRQTISSGSKHREEGWKNEAPQSIFDEIRGVWIADETLSRIANSEEITQIIFCAVCYLTVLVHTKTTIHLSVGG